MSDVVNGLGGQIVVTFLVGALVGALVYRYFSNR